jgi:hypothetical protein
MKILSLRIYRRQPFFYAKPAQETAGKITIVFMFSHALVQLAR